MILAERKHERYPVHVPVFVTVSGATVFTKDITLACEDISAGGMCFETHQKLEIDTSSRIIVSKLGDLPADACIEGRIAWVKEVEGGLYRVGVEFTGFHRTTVEELVERIEKWVSRRTQPITVFERKA